MAQGDLYFDTILPRHRRLITRHLRRGGRVFVFDRDWCLREYAQPWLRRLIDRDEITRLLFPPYSRADALALDAAEWAAARYAPHSLTGALAGLYAADDVALAWRKALVEPLFHYCYIRLTLAERSGDAREPMALIGAEFWDWHRRMAAWADAALPPLPPLRGPARPSWHGALEAVQRIAFNLTAAAWLMIHAACTRLGRMRPPAPAIPARYVYAIDQMFQMKFQGPRRFDFLLDHRRLTRGNTLIVIHPNADGPWVDAALETGARVVRRAAIADARRPWLALRRPSRQARLRAIAAVARELARHPLTARWAADTALRGALTRLTVGAVVEQVDRPHYIYMNQDNVAQVWINALIRRLGGQTWNFSFAIGGGYLYGTERDSGHLFRYLGYANSDHFVGAGERLIAYHRRHRQAVRAYHETGILWAELIGDLSRADAGALRRAWFPYLAPDAKVLAWFDTSFIEAAGSISTFTEAIQWYEDLERLLDADHSLYALIKPSKDEAYFTGPATRYAHSLGPALMEVWNRLKQHPRVHFAGHDADPVTVIAASDLTVTFCFSSPTADALAAGRRGIWYEPGTRWRRTLYGAEPLFTAHGYEELHRLVSEMLSMAEPVYQARVAPLVRALIDRSPQPRALSEFRAMLAEQETASRATAPKMPQELAGAEA